MQRQKVGDCLPIKPRKLDRGAPAPPLPKTNPNFFEDKTESGLLEED